MAVLQKVVFSYLCLNNNVVTLGDINECEISQRRGRMGLAFNISEAIYLDVDIHQSLAEFNCSEWAPEPDPAPILDFKIALRSIPTWMLIYSKALPGCGHRIVATMKAKCSKSNYSGFIHKLRSLLSPSQCHSFEYEKALVLWNERCAPHSSPVVNHVKLKAPFSGQFTLADLERLKNDERWLSDSHVTLALQDCLLNCAKGNFWGSKRIKLMDTSFWEKLSEDPDGYHEGYRRKQKLLEFDFALMPMFKDLHWRLGIIEKPGEFLQGNTILHILDSLPTSSLGMKEGKQLQHIFLKHFEETPFKEGRISTNVPQVPRQPNEKDCACFTIYFAKKFLQDPESMLTLVKSEFSSPAQAMEPWGLRNSDMTFVRREIRSLLFKYVVQGEAAVVFE